MDNFYKTSESYGPGDAGDEHPNNRSSKKAKNNDEIKPTNTSRIVLSKDSEKDESD